MKRSNQPTTVADAIARLDTLDEDDVIFARKPWSPTAVAMIGPLDEDPAALQTAGFAYFLEVSVAREILEGPPLTLDERIRLILHYAEYDAYPDWLDNRRG
jgi:hypothetical protein